MAAAVAAAAIVVVAVAHGSAVAAGHRPALAHCKSPRCSSPSTSGICWWTESSGLKRALRFKHFVGGDTPKQFCRIDIKRWTYHAREPVHNWQIGAEVREADCPHGVLYSQPVSPGPLFPISTLYSDHEGVLHVRRVYRAAIGGFALRKHIMLNEMTDHPSFHPSPQQCNG
ncbi:hypothetical protein C8R45DRAFT_386495 [Mycena sanguinolenta]|nr:hypothetical protein C8R45DRAFT_386495 [Mycena sanguinolenta]